MAANQLADRKLSTACVCILYIQPGCMYIYEEKIIVIWVNYILSLLIIGVLTLYYMNY